MMPMTSKQFDQGERPASRRTMRINVMLHMSRVCVHQRLLVHLRR